MLNEKQLAKFKRVLNERYRMLRAEIRDELLASDKEHYIDLAGQVHDLEEESVADLLVDLDLAVIDMHVTEIRAIDAALMRIAHGEYGECTDCGDAIDAKRLDAQPTATRCGPCQANYERNHVGPRMPTL